MKFTKMHVNGNDFVILDAINGQVPEDYEEAAKEICNRNLGVGCNAMVIILNSQKADFLVRVFKENSSEPRISANAILCASRYAYDNKITEKKAIKVETRAKIVNVNIEDDNISADIGEPDLETKKIPSTINKTRFVNEQLKLKDRIIRATCMSLGNPHCIVFVDKLAKYNIWEEGPVIGKHEEFPRGTNVEFVQVLNDKEIQVRVWERGGVGEKLSCGTGACAAVVACVLNKKTGRKLTIHTKGGDVEAEWREKDNHLIVKAKPEYVFEGDIKYG